ncbi:MAG: F0F1 ATP synthase subunit delta [Legionellales bacterium]|jgi:F-type H+-transporting ATPase subunit delta|nr:F0F1 ATP synthase subunit delta [Legionellales bacterium]
MSNAGIARPYAEAIFAISIGDNKQEQIKIFLINLAAVVEHKEIKSLLKNPGFSKERQLSLLTKILKLKPGLEYNILNKLIRSSRVILAPEIQDLYNKSCDIYNNQQEVVITSAHPLSDTQQQTLCENLTKQTQKQVRAIFNIDENLIGGFRVKINDYVEDHSVSGMLEKLQQALINYEDSSYATT